MKKPLIALIILGTLTVSNIRPSYAIFGVGDIVFDPAQFGQFLVDEGIQTSQLGSEVVTAGASTLGSIQQTLETVNNNVLIPARDVMTLISIVKSGQMMQNLILGSMGVDPLLVRNPEKYIRAKGEDALRSAVENPELQKGLYSASIMKATVEKAKYDSSSLQAKLQSATKSNIPAIEQKTRCNDANLSAMARKDVTDANGNYSQASFAARKRELNGALCGNINDPQVQANLLAVANKNPSWNTWLAVTGGENEWNKQQKGIQITEEEAAKRRLAATEDLKNGKGIKSQVKCTKYTVPGDTNSGCVEEVIQKTADVIGSSFKDALSNPLKAQLAGFGKGAGTLMSSVTSLAGTAFTTMGLINGISGGFGNTGTNVNYSGVKYSGGGTSVSSANNTGNVNTAVVITKTATNDLANNPQTKATITKTPLEQLNTHKQSLNELIAADNEYLSTVNLEKSNLDSMKSCYDNLASQYPELQSDNRLASAQSFYESKIGENSTKSSSAITEKNLAAEGISLINDTIAKIQSSQSSEQILNLFLGYQDSFNAKGIPQQTASIARKGEQVTYSQKVQQSMRESGGDIYGYNNTCSQIRQEQAARGGGYYGGGGGGGI